MSIWLAFNIIFLTSVTEINTNIRFEVPCFYTDSKIESSKISPALAEKINQLIKANDIVVPKRSKLLCFYRDQLFFINIPVELKDQSGESLIMIFNISIDEATQSIVESDWSRD